jgi:hypothetical protein
VVVLVVVVEVVPVVAGPVQLHRIRLKQQTTKNDLLVIVVILTINRIPYDFSIWWSLFVVVLMTGLTDVVWSMCML